jgi:2,4-dienoyl-CoA reductase-like NADH-dependent reductase (Old Yellow Enzyme family)
MCCRKTIMPLFTPLPLRDVTLRNRIAMSPMCLYSAVDGRANDWHLVHYASRAVGGVGLVVFEATAVEARGRISPADLGIWDDAQVEPLARVTGLVAAAGAVPCLQLAHAGRKASSLPLHEGRGPLPPAKGGWPTVSASALPFADGYAAPEPLDTAGIADVTRAFADAARRALAAGFRALEIHAAHGYLLHQFLSPLSNRRDDDYGGGLEGRSRLLREVVTAVRGVWPERLPLLIRLSATDWVDGGWGIEEAVDICRGLAPLGVDLVDVSSGGLIPTAAPPIGPGYQAHFAERIRRETRLKTGAVGLLTTPEQADHVLRSGQADVVLLGRELLRDPYFALRAATRLGQEGPWPHQYLRARP